MSRSKQNEQDERDVRIADRVLLVFMHILDEVMTRVPETSTDAGVAAAAVMAASVSMGNAIDGVGDQIAVNG
jgi:hypothetical protein